MSAAATLAKIAGGNVVEAQQLEAGMTILTTAGEGIVKNVEQWDADRYSITAEYKDSRFGWAYDERQLVPATFAYATI